MRKQNQKNRFYFSVIPFILFIGMMVFLFWLNQSQNLGYSSWGVYPRELSGLKGILFAPFIHGSVEHLFNNSFPIIILGTALFFYYGRLGVKVFAIMYLLSGFLVWLSARGSYHIGASGLVYALAGFLFLSGLLRKEKKLMALSLLVTFMYGSLFWGIFPVKERVSWESHFWGGVIGFVLAWYYRKEGPQRVKYDWEHEEDEEDPKFEWEHLKNRDSGYETTQTQNQKFQSKPKNRIVVKYDYKKKSKE
jgi:membrane associated rhomboid family serine protease